MRDVVAEMSEVTEGALGPVGPIITRRKNHATNTDIPARRGH